MIPPPCVSQASREEALEVFSATADAPRSRARARLGHIVVSQDAHEVGEGQRKRKQRSRQPACHSQTGKSCLIGVSGVHKAHHPGWKVHVDATYGPRHVTAQYAYAFVMHCSILLQGGGQHTVLHTFCTSRPFQPMMHFNQSPTFASSARMGIRLGKKHMSVTVLLAYVHDADIALAYMASIESGQSNDRSR